MTQKELVQQIAGYIRTYEFEQGDQYGTWVDKSPDAEELARAIEANFIEKDYVCPQCGATDPEKHEGGYPAHAL